MNREFTFPILKIRTRTRNEESYSLLANFQITKSGSKNKHTNKQNVTLNFNQLLYLINV